MLLEKPHVRRIGLVLLITATLFGPVNSFAEGGKKPLRVYVLVGQSNMVGTGAISTIDYIGEDPATAGLYKSMLDEEGKPKTCERVWISSLNGKYRTYGGEGLGKLSPGYGLRREDPATPGDCIGPEYTFGITMEQQSDGPILIIKTAWGGKSLHLEYRPPSAGEYQLPGELVEKFREKGVLEAKQAEVEEYSGKYYRYMIEHVKKVLGDIKRVCPEYEPEAGYELAGFVWFQGWNDYAATAEYPASKGDAQFATYSDLLCHLIRDVRNDLNTPKLPFVIGVIGVNGNHTPGLFSGPPNAQEKMERLRTAMAAPAQLDEFKDSVMAVPTAPFWDDKLGNLGMKQLKVQRMRTSIYKKSESGPNADGSMSQADIKRFMEDYISEIFTPEELAFKERASGTGGFVHYYGSAKFHAQAGQAFAEALLSNQAQ